MNLLTKFIPLAVIFFLTSISVQGQYSAKHWYFGEGAGIKFHNGSVSPLVNGALHSIESCASYTDSTGALRAYAHGERIWNAHHLPMTNGANISGHTSAAQGALFVPHPGKPNLIFFFTLGEHGNTNVLASSIIDFSLQNGLGAVVTKNNQLVSNMSEQLAAFRNRDGSYWIVAHGYLNDNFYAFKLDKNGLNPVPVISSAGPIDRSGIGCMAISPNGKYLAASFREMHTYILCDFDQHTGSVSNALGLGTNLFLGYGVAFSPDSRKVYTLRSEESEPNGSTTPSAIVQFDLSVPRQQIIQSKQSIGTVRVALPGAMQLGPDGKVYVSRFGSSFLGVIQKPNRVGIHAGYQDQAQSLLGNSGSMGLPNFPSNTNLPSPEINVEDVCQGDQTSLAASEVIAVDSLWWEVRDHQGYVIAKPTGNPAPVIFPNYGLHEVRLLYARGDYIDTVSKVYRVYANPTVQLGNDTLVCPQNELLLDAWKPWMHGDTTVLFSWQNGNPLPQYKADRAGLYHIEVRNRCGFARDSIQIGWRDLPTVNLGADQLLCVNDTLSLSVSPAYPGSRVLWSTGEKDTTIHVSNIAQVQVWVEDACGRASDEINFTWEKLPDFTLPTEKDLCTGEVLTVNAGPDPSWVQYRWNDGTPGPERAIVEEGEYEVTMTGKVCEAKATIQVQELFTPEPDLGPDTVVCLGERIFLDAYSPRSSYLWNTGATGSRFWVDVPGQYIVTVNNRCGIGRDTMTFETHSLPEVHLGNDTSICPHVPFLFDVRSEAGGITYQWDDGDQKPIRYVQGPNMYSVTLQNQCGTARDSITISLDEDRCVCNAFVPNIFTPNGDGANDVFEIQTGCAPAQYELKVFDRYGELMFRTADPTTHWPGYSQKGRPCAAGVYYYVLSFRTDQAVRGNKVMKGTVTLMR